MPTNNKDNKTRNAKGATTAEKRARIEEGKARHEAAFNEKWRMATHSTTPLQDFTCTMTTTDTVKWVQMISGEVKCN